MPAWHQLGWILALICGVAPLWAATNLPLVDLPQHLHLISVLHRLDDASTIFPEFFARRPVLTPYLGYYYLVSALNYFFPIELANRLFLSAYVAGLPLSLAFLLKSLRRPTWPALLALPFAYGDSFAWGFLNYCSALPLAFVTCGCFVRAIDDVPNRKKWAKWAAAMLASVLLFHVQVFAWLAFALPWLLVSTSTPRSSDAGLMGWLKPRVYALASVVPGVAMFFVWIGTRLGAPTEIAPGEPWKAWGPMFSPQNLGWKSGAQPPADASTLEAFIYMARQSFDQNVAEFVPTLSGLLSDGADQLAVKVAFGLAIAGAVLAFVTGRANVDGALSRFRIVGLAVLALALFFALPFDIRGYMYYLNTRYAHLAAALLVCCVPVVQAEWNKRLVGAGVIVAIITAMPLWRAFSAFDDESRALTKLAQAAAPKAKVYGMIVGGGFGSRVVRLPVYLHAAAVVAREAGGLTNFSFATTPHSPLMYRAVTPPTPKSEWHPEQLDWQNQGAFYDHFVVRGATPEQIFRGLMQTDLYVAAQEQDFYLVRRRQR